MCENETFLEIFITSRLWFYAGVPSSRPGRSILQSRDDTRRRSDRDSAPHTAARVSLEGTGPRSCTQTPNTDFRLWRTAASERTRGTRVNLQRSRVSRAANALSGDVVARGVVLAQAFLLAVVAIGVAFAEVLAAPAAVPGRADAGSGDGVTQRLVLTLTAAAAVRTPVITVTCCANTQSCFSLPHKTK